MRRKLFAIAIFLIIVQMILQPISICAAVFSTSKSKEAIIMYGNPDIYENASVTLSGNQSKVDISGKKALELGTSDPNLYMFVDINDDFIYAPQGTAVKISVEYLDKGNGKFSVSYDGINNGNTGITDAETVNLNNTGEWLVHDFLIDDIKCINGISQADFRIATCSDVMGKSSESVYIASVIVNKSLSTNPALISVQSGHVGNIYGGDDDKKMTVNFKSIYDNILKAKISYKVINSSNNICDRGEFETEIGEGEEFNQIIDLNKCDRFDTYKLELSMNYSAIINGETKESENTKTFKFSVANKSKAGEGNKHLKTNAYIQYPEESLTLTVDAGFGGLRNGTYWPYYEQTVKGQYDGAGAGGHKNHREMNDNIEAQSAKLHLSNMRMIIGGNPLYEPEKFTDSGAAARPEVVVPTSDEAIQGFANFAAHIATRYKDTIDSIEVWNEFNSKGFNYYLNDGADYATLLKATYTAVKAVNPDITVIALTPAYDPSNSLFKDFVEKALVNGAYDYMDAVSFHPYDGADGGYRLWYLRKRVEQYREMFKPYGEPKPIWISEVGSPTVINKGYGATESRQAANFVRICTYAIGEKLADKISWYNLVNTGKDVNNTEHCWGLVYSANSEKDAFAAKPAYISAAAMNKMLHDAEISDKFINEDTNVYGYDFKDSAGNDTAVVWSENGQQTIGLSLGATKIDLYDINSNHIGTMESEDGNYSFSVDIDAIYIKGRFSEFKEVNPDITHDSINVEIETGCTTVISFFDEKNRKLRIESEMPEDVIVKYSTGSTSGKVSIQTLSRASGSYRGTLKFYEDNNLIYRTVLNVNVISDVCTSHNYIIENVCRSSCSEQGYTVFKCTSCGKTYNDNYTDKLAHDYKVSEKEATYLNYGYTAYDCSNCGDSHRVKYTMPIGYYIMVNIVDDNFDSYESIKDVSSWWKVSPKKTDTKAREVTLETGTEDKAIKLNGNNAAIYKNLTSNPLTAGKIKVSANIKPSNRTAFGFVSNGEAMNDAGTIKPIAYFINDKVYTFLTGENNGLYVGTFTPGNEYLIEAEIDMDKKMMNVKMTGVTNTAESAEKKDVNIAVYNTKFNVNSITAFGVAHYGGTLNETVTYFDDFKAEISTERITTEMMLRNLDGTKINSVSDIGKGRKIRVELNYLNSGSEKTDAKAIVAYYKDDILRYVELKPISLEKTQFIKTVYTDEVSGDVSDFNKIKVMLWDFDLNIPLADSMLYN